MKPLLETGHDASTPVTDSVVRRFLANHADHMDAVALGAGGRTLRTAAFASADIGRPSAIHNSTTLLEPLGAAPDRVVSEIERFHRGGDGTVYLWSCWPTPDLSGRGWVLQGHPTFMVRSGGLPLPETAPVDIVKVTDSATLRDWERVVAEGFPFPDTVAHLPGAFASEGYLADPRSSMFLVYADGRPVTAASLFVAHGFAQLTLGVTRPEARRRGHWAGLVRERLAIAADLPSGSLFGDDSRPGAERFGFLPLFRFTLWALERGEAAGDRAGPGTAG
ncbi:GNAT family N-acetyltransferase [Actinokineospora sp. 24-640]